MPANTSKGNHGTRDAGSAGRGNQKAVTGSAVSPEVAQARQELHDDEEAEPTS